MAIGQAATYSAQSRSISGREAGNTFLYFFNPMKISTQTDIYGNSYLPYRIPILSEVGGGRAGRGAGRGAGWRAGWRQGGGRAEGKIVLGQSNCFDTLIRMEEAVSVHWIEWVLEWVSGIVSEIVSGWDSEWVGEWVHTILTRVPTKFSSSESAHEMPLQINLGICLMPLNIPALCVDIFGNGTECGIFASDGECERSPDWMKVNCRKACGLCGNIQFPSTSSPNRSNPNIFESITPPSRELVFFLFLCSSNMYLGCCHVILWPFEVLKRVKRHKRVQLSFFAIFIQVKYLATHYFQISLQVRSPNMAFFKIWHRNDFHASTTKYTVPMFSQS